jgi:hypothetical protein
MPNDFQQGFQSGSAVFAPFIAATQQGQALQVAQQQEQARRMFQAQQLQSELDARSKLARADQLFRAKQAADQLAAAAAEAEKSRMFTAQRDETRFDNEFTQQQEDQGLIDRRAKERQANTTRVASALFGRVNQVSNDITNALQLTPQDQEQALAAALQLTGVDIKRSRGEDVSAYLNKVAQKNPEVLAEYSAQLQAIQQSKAASPDVLNLQTQGQILGNIFQNVMRSGDVDPSFLDNVPPQQQAVNPDDLSAFAPSLPGSGQQAQSPALPEGVLAPATSGMARGLQNAFNPVVSSQAPSIPDVSNLLFGAPPVSYADIPSLEAFAVQSGIDAKQFQDLVNNAPTDSGAQKALRDLKQRKLQSDAMQNRPTQRNLMGTDLKIPTETGPMFR